MTILRGGALMDHARAMWKRHMRETITVKTPTAVATDEGHTTTYATRSVIGAVRPLGNSPSEQLIASTHSGRKLLKVYVPYGTKVLMKDVLTLTDELGVSHTLEVIDVSSWGGEPISEVVIVQEIV